MIPIGAITGAIGLATQGMGAVKGAQANKRQQDFLNKRQRENEAAFNLDAKQDFLDTNAAKGVVERLRKDLKKRNDATDSKAEITGATAENKIAQKTANQEGYNDTLSRVASMATNYQDRAKYRFNRNKYSLDNMQMGLNNQKAQNASNMMGIGSNLMGTAATLHAMNSTLPSKDDIALKNAQNKVKDTDDKLRGLSYSWLKNVDLG